LSQFSLLLAGWAEMEIANTSIRSSWLVFLRITNLPLCLKPYD
jgi:hypothetical protein